MTIVGSPPGRYVFIDGLRGFAALAVALFHARAGHHIDALAATWPGILDAVVLHADNAVQVFFVLSGFVIAHSMIRHHVSFGYVGRFIVRRSIRLDPPYWASMALSVGLAIVSTRFVAGKIYESPGTVDVLLHMLYVPDLCRIPLINSVYWTLCLEFQFYLVFALMMLVVTFLRRWTSPQRAFCAVLIPAIAVAALWPLRLPLVQVPGLFLGQWHLFLAGVAVYWTIARPDDRFAAWLAYADLALLGGASAVFTDVSVGVGTVTALVILLAGRRNGLVSWLRWKPFQALGAISYSLYLIHNPVTGALFRVGYRLTGRSIALEALWLTLALAGCVALGWLFYRAVEKPSLELSRHIRLGPATPGPGQPSRDGTYSLS